MELGVLPPYRTGVTADPAWIAGFAQHAEACGFESIYVAEHVVVVPGYASRYPYAESGRMPLPDDVAIPDPLDLLAFLAGVTSRIRLGTGILVLPEHHPVQLAKRVSTIDQLSGGRVTLGVGVGWMREELEAMGVDPTTRGARTDECIDAVLALWRDEQASFQGTHFSFSGVCSNPKPLQRRADGTPGVPIHIGGHSAAAARRAGRMADGFHPLGLAGDLLDERLAQLREAAETAGRDPSSVELSLGGVLDQLDEERISVAAAAGAHRLVLGTRESDLDKLKDAMSAVADRFLTTTTGRS
jgi:probable F420-dependent oxidoreductase